MPSSVTSCSIGIKRTCSSESLAQLTPTIVEPSSERETAIADASQSAPIIIAAMPISGFLDCRIIEPEPTTSATKSTVPGVDQPAQATIE